MSSTVRAQRAAAWTTAIWLLVTDAHAIGSAQQDPPGQTMTLRMIVVSSAEAAQRIVERLNGGEGFLALAQAESTSPGAHSGGGLGNLTLSQLLPEPPRVL